MVIPFALLVHDLEGFLSLARHEPGALNYLRTGPAARATWSLPSCSGQARGLSVESLEVDMAAGEAVSFHETLSSPGRVQFMLG